MRNLASRGYALSVILKGKGTEGLKFISSVPFNTSLLICGRLEKAAHFFSKVWIEREIIMTITQHRTQSGARVLLNIVFAIFAVSVCSVANAADPLPSWNDGSAKQAILEFVAAVVECLTI